MANTITNTGNARRNNHNGRKIKIYCHNVYGVNWLMVEVNGNKVLDGEKILAEGDVQLCKEYKDLCVVMKNLLGFFETRKNGELWKSPVVRELSKEIVKLSKHIRIEDTFGTIRKAHEIVKELREAWQRKQVKREREKDRAEKSTLQLLEHTKSMLENGSSSTEVIPLIEKAVRITEQHDLGLMPNIKRVVDIAVLKLG